MRYMIPDISVIIPAYNAERFIARSLDSVWKQDFHGSMEVLVIDDCSSDATFNLLQKTASAEPRLKVLRQERNQGPAAARNRGIAASSGRYIAFLDADDYWKPSFLKKTSDFLDANQDAACVFVGQEHKTVSAESSIEPKCLVRGTAPEMPLVLDDFFVFWREQGVTPLCSGSLMIRGELLRKIGGQREEFRVCEDLEYWCYIALHGKIGFIPEILFVSDGARNGEARKKLTRRQRLQRYAPRWKNARRMAEWGERLFATKSPILETDAFRYVMGDVAGIMIYSMIQDRRWGCALEEYRQYKDCLPRNAVNRLLAHFCFFACLWYCACFLLYLRERLKK